MRKYIEAINFAFDASRVIRYHTLYTLKEETVGHHSHGVAMILIIMHPDSSSNLIKAALLHDLEEKVTGDLPSTVKRELGLRRVLDDYGKAVMEDAGLEVPILSFAEEVRLKFADSAHGALKCLEEMTAGNKHLYGTLHNYIEYMEALKEDLVEKEIQFLSWIRVQATEYLILPEPLTKNV